MGWAEDLEATAPDAPPKAEPMPDAEVVARDLAKLSPLAYDQRRDEEAKRLGVRTKTLDDAVRRYRGDEEAKGAALLFPAVESSPTPVDAATLLDDVAGTLSRHVILPEHGANVVALWVLFAWAFDAWSIAPMIQISAPERECGKTRLLEVIGALVPKPLPTGSISAAALFRVIEAHSPCLLVDETDTFLTENPELVGVLNNGYSRAQAFVIRCDGEDNAVKPFRVWGPKVLCGIGELPDTLASRCLTITMRRKRAGETVERLRADRQGWADGLRSRCLRWAADHVERLRCADPVLPDALNDRQQDNWRPLIAIADAAGGDWPARARAAALALSAPRAAQEETIGVLLLRDIQRIFEARSSGTIAPETLVDALCAISDAPWATWSRGKPITPHRIARLLSAYEIASRRNRDGRYYDRRDFADAWARYCADPPLESVTNVTPVTPVKTKGKSVTDLEPVTLQSVTPSESVTENANENKAVTDVTVVTDFEGGEL